MIERDKFYRIQEQTRGQEDTNITGGRDRPERGRDRYSRRRDKLRDRKRQIFLGMMDIILEIERHRFLGMQIDYFEEIEKVLSLSIPLFLSLSIFSLPAGMAQKTKIFSFFKPKDWLYNCGFYIKLLLYLRIRILTAPGLGSNLFSSKKMYW